MKSQKPEGKIVPKLARWPQAHQGNCRLFMNKLNKINKLKQNKRKNRDEFPSLPLTQGGFEGEQTEAGKWCPAARGCCCAIWPLTQNLAKEDVCPERGRDRHRDPPHPLPGSPAMRSRGGLVLKPCSCGGVRQGVVCASDQRRLCCCSSHTRVSQARHEERTWERLLSPLSLDPSPAFCFPLPQI